MAAFGERMRQLMDERGISLRGLAKAVNYDVGYLSKVANARKRPSIAMAERIDSALRADGSLIAIARESTSSVIPSAQDEDAEMKRRAAIQLLAALSAGAAIPASAISTILSGVNRAIGDGDDWDRNVWQYAYLGTTGPIGSMIPHLTDDIIAVGGLLGRASDPVSRAGLLRVSAQLSSLLAGELDDLGSHHAAWQAWRTARRAADASGDRDLAVWMRAREAAGAFYTGRPAHMVIPLADDAIAVAAGASSAGLAKAYEVRALVTASQGDATAAHAALRDLSEIFEALPDGVTSDTHGIGFSFPEQQLNWARSYVHARIGRRRDASPLIAETLAAYPSTLVHGVANMHYIEALSLVRDRDITEGLDHAVTSVQGIPVNAARRLIGTQIITSLPEKSRVLPAAQELRQLMTS